jgi:hypothetical protein
MKGRWHYLRTIGPGELTAQRPWAVAARGVHGGHSVTYACLQLAFHMGFRR